MRLFSDSIGRKAVMAVTGLLMVVFLIGHLLGNMTIFKGPEGINASTVPLLRRLKVDGVGMGIELATQEFRESKLNRFADQAAIERAFRLLREAGIRRTAYNIIGIPEPSEDSILETIEFNRQLEPDNVTVAFFSPYLGTEQQRRGAEQHYFLDYEFDLDSQLRTLSRHAVLSAPLLSFYKRHFVCLVRDGLERRRETW